jgi:hypothetical protein
MTTALHLPLNSTSLGQVSLSILRELYSRGEDICLFPIGNVDVSTQNKDDGFFNWIQQAINKSQSTHKRENPIFKLWHIGGSLESYSKDQVLLSFYELDSPTNTEVNIVNNNNTTIFSSNYSVSVFEQKGCNNVKYIPLGFDNVHFSKLNSRRRDSKDIHFGLFGKLEPQRKRHLKVLQNWVKKYGNRPGYFLNCALWNPFLDVNAQSQLIGQALNGQRYWNVNFLPYMETNSSYNEFINNNDIALAMSGGEGWGLPEFQSVALGKHCVGLNAHSYKDWMNDKNTILVNPSGKIPAYDNIFFREGTEFNQGNIFDWNDDEFISAMEKAESRFKDSPENTEGLKLQQEFTYTKTVDSILDVLNSIK